MYSEFITNFSVGPGILALLVWTLMSGLLLLMLRYYEKWSAVLKYHVSSAALMALPVGLAAVYAIDFSWVVPSAFVLPAFGWVPAFEMETILVTAIGQPAGTEAAAGISGAQIILGTLGIMILAGWLRMSVIYVRLKLALKRARPVENEACLRIVKQVQCTLGLRRSIRLFESTETSVPFTTGLIRPVIIIPAALSAEEDQLKMILTHEAVHISRYDYALHLGELFIRHTFWMHPLVHWLYGQAAYWREVSCDAEVLQTENPDSARYASMLYNFAINSREKPAFKAAMAEEKKLISRIRAFSNHTTTNKEISMTKSIIAAFGVLLITAGMMACSDLAKNPEAEQLSLDDTVELHGQEFQISQLREMIVSMRSGYENELENLNESRPDVADRLRESISNLDNFLMLIDSGNAGRVVQGLEELMTHNPPPAPQRPDANVFVVVEEMPQMVGGQMALYEKLRYPETARRAGIEGRVIIQFIVNKEGEVVNPAVVRSAGGGLDEAALEALKSVSFTPGTQRGELVDVQMTLPVVFRLN